jgi:hypothetical protein
MDWRDFYKELIAINILRACEQYQNKWSEGAKTEFQKRGKRRRFKIPDD